MKQSFPVSTAIQLSTVLRALRKSKGLTQEKLGSLIGVSQKRLAAIEAKPERTSFDQISQMVSAMGGRLTIEIPGPPEHSNRVRETSEVYW